MSTVTNSLHPILSLTMLIVLGALLLLVMATALLRGGRPWHAHIQRKPLMTENEKAFFNYLQRALPGHAVFPQVSFAAIMTDDGKLTQQKRWAVRSRFNRRIVDFVVCERETLGIIALVELDDRTHSAKMDRDRDELTKAAGYQTFRFQSKQRPPESEIAALFKLSTSVPVSKEPQEQQSRVSRR